MSEASSLSKYLSTSENYFEQIMGKAHFCQGWKLSIQGESLDDIDYLNERLSPFLYASNASFKFATLKLIESDIPQQKNKVLTIYIPNDVNVISFAELVWLNIKDYKGGENVEKPDSYNHYKGAIYFRNDRDENGNYIKAN